MLSVARQKAQGVKYDGHRSLYNMSNQLQVPPVMRLLHAKIHPLQHPSRNLGKASMRIAIVTMRANMSSSSFLSTTTSIWSSHGTEI
jgi:hypothetical protein